VDVELFILYAEHFGDRGAEDVGVEEPYSVAFAGEGCGEVGCDGGFAYTTLAGGYAYDVLHTREYGCRGSRSRLACCGVHGDCDLGGYVGVYGCFGSFCH
jgi:hypothetical protein